jgi:hypothetical protein
MMLLRSCSLLAVTLGLIAGCSDDSSDSPAGGGAGSGGQGAGGSSAGSGAGRSPEAGTGAGGAGKAGSGGSAGNAGSATGGRDGSSAGSGGSAQAGAGGEAGADPGQDVIATCLDAQVIDDTRTEALTLKGDGVTVAVVRRVDPDGVGTSGTTIWLPQRFGIEKGALAQCVTSDADMTYTISHHNFDDEMTAKVDGQTLLVSLTRVDYDTPTAWDVTAKQGDAALWGPLTLALVACKRLDSGENCLPMYQ